MSLSEEVYVGVYFRVYMPKEKYTNGMVCPRCGKITYDGVFCDKDGSRLVEYIREGMTSLGDLCEEIFGDEDRFSRADIDTKDFVIVLGNMDNQPGYMIAQNGEEEIPGKDYSGDWQTLADALDKRGVKYEKRYGVVSYWS